jgi:glutamyl-tRNA synthetase
MTVSVRFAPSPTGYLHVGNVRTALVNFLFARKAGGRFLLRIDDTDAGRSRLEYVDAIEEDLRWLGIIRDDFRKQSERLADYEAARRKLVAAGRLYPCYETPEELDMRRKMQAGRGLPPVYDRAALRLTQAWKEKYEREGRRPHYRFLLEDRPVLWDDLVRGEVRFEGAYASDPVLVREDGVPLYTLASVVDDADMGITHILRGEDHVSNTAVQMQIFTALGFIPPRFGHLALLKTSEGELSKRVGGNDIRGLRDAGIEPMTVNSLLARLGTRDPVEAFPDMQSLVDAFDIKKFGRATANYDFQELERLNGKLLHTLPFSAVKDRLPFADGHFWLSVRANVKTLAEAKEWWEIVHGDISGDCAGEEDYLRKALAVLPSGRWDEATWGMWTQAVSAATGRKGKELFLPLRLALTGLGHGPEMKLLLPLIGHEKTMQRLTK